MLFRSNELQSFAASLPTTGKIIAELKFAFWENIFTVGQDSRIWNAHFRTCFPGAPQGQPTPQCRATAYADLQIIRRLRNRIAHHEPLFMRNIAADRSEARRVGKEGVSTCRSRGAP